jgi:CO dehydrogenase maturation factor
LLGELESSGRIVVCDMEAGIGTLLRLRDGQVDVAVIVAQPTAKSIEVARRAVRTASTRARVVLVANRVREDADVELIRAGAAFEGEVVVVPDDPAVARADEEGVAPIDAAPNAPAVRALAELARLVRSG